MSRTVFHCRHHGDWIVDIFGQDCPDCAAERTGRMQRRVREHTQQEIVKLYADLAAAESRWEALRGWLEQEHKMNVHRYGLEDGDTDTSKNALAKMAELEDAK